MVVSVGIDVSKDKHDCFIVSAEGEVLADVFTVPNNMDGFHCLLQMLMCDKVTLEFDRQQPIIPILYFDAENSIIHSINYVIIGAANLANKYV